MRLLLLLPLMFIAATPTPVVQRSVDMGYNSSITVTTKGQQVYMEFRDGDDYFQCHEFGRKTRFHKYEQFLRDVAELAPNNNNADFGYAITGYASFAGSQAPGYCNMTADTRNGLLIVSVYHNDKCFDSAGCLTTYASYVTDPNEIMRVADNISQALGE